jgi:ribose transport system ATP-binding protein
VDGIFGAEQPRGASLELRRGEILGIAGLVGSGRTEILRAVFGLDPVRRGSLVVRGLSGPASPRRRWSQGVGFASEDRQGEGLALGLSIARNVALADPRGGFFAPPGALDRFASPALGALDVRCRSPRQPVAELSGGNQQKVALARLLAAGSDVLLLDEPTRGIDAGARAEVHAWIDAFARGEASRGRPASAVLLVSSHLPELLALCDRVAVLRAGRLGPARPVSGLDERALLLEASIDGEQAR